MRNRRYRNDYDDFRSSERHDQDRRPRNNMRRDRWSDQDNWRQHNRDRDLDRDLRNRRNDFNSDFGGMGSMRGRHSHGPDRNHRVDSMDRGYRSNQRFGRRNERDYDSDYNSRRMDRYGSNSRDRGYRNSYEYDDDYRDVG